MKLSLPKAERRAFARYRVGDVYRCLGLTSKEDETRIPRFEYIDRVPDIIDIAGFSAISENSIKNVISLSGIDVTDWAALKEFTEDRGRPYSICTWNWRRAAW